MVYITVIIEFNTHCLKSNYSNKTNFEELFFLYGRSVKNIVHFYFLKDIDVGMHYFPEFEFDTHCNANRKNLFLVSQFENIVHFYFVRTLVGTIFPLKFDMHCAMNPNILTKR